MPFINPIIPGFHPDPSVCRVGEDYYLVTSSFEFFPGLPLFHSRDLVHWEQLGHVLDRDSQLPLNGCRVSGGLFAPTIRHHDGMFYVICTNISGGGNFIVHAADPRGPWSEPAWVKQRGIDPSLLFDEDGKVYFTSTYYENGHSGIGQCEIDPISGEMLSETRMISLGAGGRFPEAPHLYKIGGRYYLMLAEGGTEYGHMETIQRADNPWGPFLPCPRNPILTNRNESFNPVMGTGHADLVETPQGDWWMVFLAFRVSENYFHHLGRETFLAPVEWIDGWPVVNGGRPIAMEMDAVTLPAQPFPARPAREDFHSPVWNYLRNPDRSAYQIDADGLTLRGRAATLDEDASPTFYGRRQEQFSMRATTRLEALALGEGARTGLCAFYNGQQHFEIFLTRRDGACLLGLRKTFGDMVAETLKPWEGAAILEIRADKTRYAFYAGREGEAMAEIGGGFTRMLSTEAGPASFTGVYIGLFAEGDGAGRFSWFEYADEIGETKPNRPF